MKHASYPYERGPNKVYFFTSTGKQIIKKQVDFTPTTTPKIVNMGFGDVLENGEIDDAARSNNGDMVKVLSTVIQIIGEYATENPGIQIYFLGSTNNRTRLYGRIIRTHYESLSKEFSIKGLIVQGEWFTKTSFNPDKYLEYSAFLIGKLY